MSQTSTSSTLSNQIQIPCVLHWSQDSLPIQVLIDAGGDDNFIDSDLALKAYIPITKLSETKDVLALDGRLSGITHRTVPLSLMLTGNHHETIKLFVVPSPLSPVVLGMPWLKEHNPQIDWSIVSLSNWSSECHAHRLR